MLMIHETKSNDWWGNSLSCACSRMCHVLVQTEHDSTTSADKVPVG